MSTSPTDICNIALVWLGARRITTIDGAGEESKVCRAFYDSSRRILLEDAEWTFAIKRVKLNQIEEPPPFSWDFQYSLPPDFIRSIQAYDHPDRRATPIEHVIESGRLLSDRAEVYIRYMFDVEDTNEFSGYFVQAFAAQLASNMAMLLTGDLEKQMDMLTIYVDKLERGSTSDGLQGSREFLQRSQLESSRRHFIRID